MSKLLYIHFICSLFFWMPHNPNDNEYLNKNEFNISIVKAYTDEAGNSVFIIRFDVPELSDELMNKESLTCKGWMPTGADIKKIKIIGIEGITQDHTWSCLDDDCTWEGGSSGKIKVVIKKPIKQEKYNILVKIEGLGSFFGIERWYNCELKLEI